ncbi:MAG TPA: hypothetical protein VES67_25510 [Vicinamibacterales bacterium]|nr:hypothetical protein [Vicinamibacterales bacterium]
MTEQAVPKARTNPRNKKGRSPAYPGIDLKRALELATVVYKADRQHSTAPEAVAQHWKLKPLSSAFLTNISAVKKFGLLDAAPQRGPHSGQVKVSDLARDIIVDEREDSMERETAIKRAAMKPEIHASLWKKYDGQLPSDSNLKFYLVRDLKFTEVGAADFISQFRRTIAFAGLGSSDVLSASEDDKLAPDEGTQANRMTELVDRLEGFPPRPAQTRPGQMREVPIPIQGTAWPALKAAFPMTEEAWTQMLTVLTAMKPGLVEPKKDE